MDTFIPLLIMTETIRSTDGTVTDLHYILFVFVLKHLFSTLCFNKIEIIWFTASAVFGITVLIYFRDEERQYICFLDLYHTFHARTQDNTLQPPIFPHNIPVR